MSLGKGFYGLQSCGKLVLNHTCIITTTSCLTIFGGQNDLYSDFLFVNRETMNILHLQTYIFIAKDLNIEKWGYKHIDDLTLSSPS